MIAGILILCVLFIPKSCAICSDAEACTRFAYEYQLMERLLTLEMEKAELANRVTALERKCSSTDTNPVAFKVRLSADGQLNLGQKLLYDVEVSNIGKAFDLQHGFFEAPVSGVYLFSVTCCSTNNDWIVLDIVQDGNKVGEVRSGDTEYKDCNSETTIIHMEKGDKVWVERRFEGNSGLYSTQHWNSFTGSLILPD